LDAKLCFAAIDFVGALKKQSFLIKWVPKRSLGTRGKKLKTEN